MSASDAPVSVLRRRLRTAATGIVLLGAITSTVIAGQSSSADAAGPGHVVDVAVVSATTQSMDVASDAIHAEVATLDAYWSSATDDAVTGFSVGQIVRFTSDVVPGTAVTAQQLADEAAHHFGVADASAYLHGESRHLLVMVSIDLTAETLNSTGSWIGMGGYSVIPGQLTPNRWLDAIGHHIGLGDGWQCSDGLDVAICDTNPNNPYSPMAEYLAYDSAPNAAQLHLLGVTGGGREVTVLVPPGQPGTTMEFDLRSATSGAGLRAIRVVTPTNHVFYVEYRDGTGLDEGAAYMPVVWSPGDPVPPVPGPFFFGPGVIVTEATGETSQLMLWKRDASDEWDAPLTVGDPHSTADGVLTVTVTSLEAGVAHVEVTLVGVGAPATHNVYRFWSDRYKAHFYTIDPDERDTVIELYDDREWRYEGVAYSAFDEPAPGTVPLYRFWSSTLRGHFYTASEEEREHVIDAYPDDVWLDEGVAYHVYPESPEPWVFETDTISRFWSTRFGHHFFTASAQETQTVIDVYSDDDWRYEGTGFRVPTW